MKITFKSAFAAFVALLYMAPVAMAQEGNPMAQPLPADAQLRQGVLPNGMTYYIRHNDTSKGQADFYIAQKVGSILENEEQRGLAHFLEHMCFNGTQNFPGNELVKWLETKGVQFGGDLNAYTSIDETVYNIANVPSTNTAVTDSCLLILHDWADGLLLEPEEIDKERGVIHEEWRMRNNGQQRLQEKLLPIIYPTEKYGHRLPIGLMEVVDNFPPKALRDYYETWYRPDQQGIIVVGDIDVDRTEAKIKEIFEPIKMPENPKERVYEPVADNEGTIYAIGSDPEQKNARVSMFFKNDVLPRELRNTMQGVMVNYITDMISNMLNARFEEMSSNPETPFAGAGSYYGNFYMAPTKDAFTLVGIGKGNDIRPTLASIYREALRASKGGFTITEYDRARQEYLSSLEKQYNNRDKRENESYVNEFVRGFIDGTPVWDIETQYQIMNAIAPQIPVDIINATFNQMITPDNRVVVAMLPETEGYIEPTDAMLAETITGVDGEDIAAFVDEVKAEPLIPALPKPGTIVSTKNLDKWGATEWTLSNGAKVVFKKTNFKADEIVMDAQALGGTSVFPDTYANSLILLPLVSQMGGLGDYTSKDLQKYLQGKQAGVAPSFDNYTRDISGSCTPKDLPTLMELLYMTFTAPNITEEEFAAAQASLTNMYHNQESDPQYVFSKKLLETLYSNPRRRQVSTEVIAGANRDQMLEVAKKMTANAADYTFFFVGSIDEATFRPLVEQYIASLPGDTKTAVREPLYLSSLQIQDGEPSVGYKTAMKTPTTYVAIVEYGKLPYTAKERAALSVAGDILTQRLTEKVREEMGAVYSIWAGANMNRVSDKNNAVLQSSFPVKPELKDQVLTVISEEIKGLESNITPEEIGKVIEYEVKNIQDNRERNNPWLQGMAGEALNGVDTFNPALDVYQNLTIADVQAAIKALNDQNNYRIIFLEAE